MWGKHTQRADRDDLRRHNLALVLGQLRAHGPLSRAELAGRTGLAKVTVSRLSDELRQRGLVRFGEASGDGRQGRPARPLVVDGSRVAGLGVEIDVDRIGACVVDLSGETRHCEALEVDHRGRDADSVVKQAAALATAALDAARSRGLSLAATTVSVPGVVDSGAGIVYVAPNLGWREMPVARALGEALAGRPVGIIRLENEANAAALAERGALDLDDFVYVSLGVGVGAGVVLDGELFHGARGFGAELGHTTVEPDGPECACGNRGCLEALVGRDALIALARRTLGERVEGERPAEVLHALAHLATDGDAVALDVLSRVGGRLAVALSTYANLFDPAAIVLGGYGTMLGQWLVPPIRAHLERHVLGARWSPTDVRIAEVDGNARLLGAASASVGQVFADPTLAG